MPELSLHHIDQISRDISRQEITFSHLLEDLIDHVCCDVEYEMQKGADFTDAYQKVKQKMGPRRLKEIQQETLYAVDTKYRIMKNTMKISGVAGTVLFGLAALFKIEHWPGAGIMMTLGALILAFVFLPSVLNVLWKETHNRKRIFLFISAFFAGMLFILGTLFKVQHWPFAGTILTLSVISGVLLFFPALALNRMSDHENKDKRPAYVLGASGSVLFVAGILFKMQHWPLATVFIISGIILLSFMAFPIYTRVTWKEENHVSSVFIFLVIGFYLIVIPGAMVTLNQQHSYQVHFYSNNDQQNALYNYLFSNNSTLITRYHDSLGYPKMEQLHLKTTSMLTAISNLQQKMVQESEGQPGRPAVSAAQIIQTKTGQEIIYSVLSKPFHPTPAKVFLLPGCSARIELKSSMDQYATYLANIVPAEEFLKYKNMLDAEIFLPAGKPEEVQMSLMSALHSLEIMKNGLLTVESCVLREIIKH
jgi:drug/metabolite transporter (DMT)-like permease